MKENPYQSPASSEPTTGRDPFWLTILKPALAFLIPSLIITTAFLAVLLLLAFLTRMMD